MLLHAVSFDLPRGERGWGAAMLFDKSGATRSASREDTVLSYRVARRGRRRLHPDGQRLARPNPASFLKKERRIRRDRHDC